MFKKLTRDDAKKLISDGDVIILDVRDKESYEEGHIKNAKHLSVTELQTFCETESKTQAILVYCYRGISSQSVAEYLSEQGFGEVYSLSGGFEAWEASHSPS